ncbi:MAG: 3-isopropylmalate dehydratase small subunit [Alphaproteobacteria bacterium]|nr:3-isopropylmalate dehydratase small subunit [Alphaproteobacteria bacterium]
MDKFAKLSGIAAPLPAINIDTDKIIPARFLKTIKRTGLGKNLFNDWKLNADGTERADFALNEPAYKKAEILVVGENFGCGSSREHAPWALTDAGIKCVIGTSFADIFFNNSFKNGLLLIKLAPTDVEKLMEDAKGGHNARITVDLEQQEIVRPNGAVIRFDIEPFRKKCLTEGLDDIALSLKQAPAIDAFEGRDRLSRPWLYS